MQLRLTIGVTMWKAFDTLQDTVYHGTQKTNFLELISHKYKRKVDYTTQRSWPTWAFFHLTQKQLDSQMA
jgi:hypothetical protein